METMQRGSGISLKYHDRSDVVLSRHAEAEMVGIFERKGISALFRSRSLPVMDDYEPQYGSWVSEHLALIVEVTGTIMATKLLEMVVEDLYNFFKRKITQRKGRNEKPWPVHYVILLNIDLENTPTKLAITFDDDETLDIAMWRLAQYTQSNPDAGLVEDGEDGYSELTYPLGFNPGYVKVLLLVSVVLPSTMWSVFLKLGDSLPFYDRLGQWGYMLLLIPLILALWLFVVILPYRRRSLFIAKYKALARATRASSQDRGEIPRNPESKQVTEASVHKSPKRQLVARLDVRVRKAIGFAGAAMFAIALSYSVIWLAGDKWPPIGSELALYYFFGQVALFRLMHKTRDRASSGDDTGLWTADMIFHFIPFAIALVVVKILPNVFIGSWQKFPWIAVMTASMLIHMHWNMNILEHQESLPQEQLPEPPEIAKEMQNIRQDLRIETLFAPDGISLAAIALLSFIAYTRSVAFKSLVDQSMLLTSHAFMGEPWRFLTSLLICKDVVSLTVIIVAASFAGLVAQRTTSWGHAAIVFLPGLLANVIATAFLDLAGLTQLDASLMLSISLCVAFGFLYSHLQLKTIGFNVEARILMTSLGAATILLDVTRGGWLALLRDLVVVGIALVLTIRFGQMRYTQWRVKFLKRWLKYRW